MASVTTFTCDNCGKPIGEPFGPMHVDIRNQDLIEITRADLCSWDCAVAWMQEAARETNWIG